MKYESGRSLIEVIGVLAITGIMTAAALGTYKMVRNNQTRHIANATLQEIAKNTKLLLEMRGDYTGVSVDYLVKSGAIKTDAAPIGGADWSVTSSSDGKIFSINLVELTRSECEYFVTATPTWATSMLVNGYESDPDTRCMSSSSNQISFIIE